VEGEPLLRRELEELVSLFHQNLGRDPYGRREAEGLKDPGEEVRHGPAWFPEDERVRWEDLGDHVHPVELARLQGWVVPIVPEDRPNLRSPADPLEAHGRKAATAYPPHDVVRRDESHCVGRLRQDPPPSLLQDVQGQVAEVHQLQVLDVED